jgi:hypothetical protein
MAIPRSEIVTLTVKIAGWFVVAGALFAGAATPRRRVQAPAARRPDFIVLTVPPKWRYFLLAEHPARVP